MSFFSWLTSAHCLQHADPIFDRDEIGQAIWRCPRCFQAWPRLSAEGPPRVTRLAWEPPKAEPVESAADRVRSRLAAEPSRPRIIRLASK
jgi:hypothetical protein